MTPKSSKKPPEDVEVNREILVQVVETVIPDFAKACLANIDVITIPQEQLAPDYNVDECTLLNDWRCRAKAHEPKGYLLRKK